MTLLIEVKDLEVRFPIRKKKLFSSEVKQLRAVDGVSFDIKRGETVGLVGESGSGKTTVGRAILRAIDPTDGEVIFHTNGHDVDVAHAEGEELRKFRQHMNMVFSEGLGASVDTGGRQAAPVPLQDEPRLPGSLLLPQPAHDRARHHRRTADRLRHDEGSRGHRRTGAGDRRRAAN